VALDGKRQLYAPKAVAQGTRIIVGSEHIGKEENSVLAWVPTSPLNSLTAVLGFSMYERVLKYKSAQDHF
jgi:hypothetical protein